MIEMLQATLFTTAEEACNQLLQRDPITLQHLERLSGKVIAVELTNPRLNLFLLPNTDGIQIQSVYNDKPDATLSGQAIDFLKLLATKDRVDAMFGKTIQLSGDAALATRLQEILADTQIDWEGMLGNLVGELPAHQLAIYAAWKKNGYKNAGLSVIQNLDEYLKEEVKLIPTRPEINNFYSDIDVLRDRVERLSARIAAKVKS